MKQKSFDVYFYGYVRVNAKNAEEAWENVTNEDILDNVEVDEVREIENEK